MPLGLTTEYLLIEGLEPFTLTQGGNAPVTVNNCKRLKLSYTQIQFMSQSDMGLQAGDLVVEIWANELNGLIPDEGNKLADGNGVVYRIQQIDFEPLIQKFECIVRKDRTS